MLGQEDVVNMREHTTTVKCISNEGSLFVIPADEFIARLSRDKKTWKMIIEYSLEKDE